MVFQARILHCKAILGRGQPGLIKNPSSGRDRLITHSISLSLLYSSLIGHIGHLYGSLVGHMGHSWVTWVTYICHLYRSHVGHIYGSLKGHIGHLYRSHGSHIQVTLGSHRSLFWVTQVTYIGHSQHPSRSSYIKPWQRNPCEPDFILSQADSYFSSHYKIVVCLFYFQHHPACFPSIIHYLRMSHFSH